MVHSPVLARLKSWVDFSLNPYCAFCGAARLAGKPLCTGCYADLPWFPVEHNQPVKACNVTLSAFVYQNPISHLLLAVKFGKNLRELATLSQLTAQGILPQIDKVPDAIIPVPLHKDRLRKRGFNQALELARPLAKQLAIPLITHAVVRQKATHAQTELDFAHRQYNVQQAFTLLTKLSYQHVIIFDDVITTGATSSELAALLSTHGIERVDVWSCARTLFTPHPST